MYKFIQHVAGWDCYKDLLDSDYFAIHPEYDNDGPILAPYENVNEKGKSFNEPGFQEAIAFCQAHYNLSQ